MLSTFCVLSLAASSVLAGVQYAGVNIAGFEFGCDTTGTCDITAIDPPLTALNGEDGLGQMQHFATDDQLNMFRLPVSWQFLVNNALGGPLDPTNLGKYDQLVQACLGTSAYCVIDIHNYARFNGKIIAQDDGGPTDAQFANLWAQLAIKYKKSSKVVFGIMNEPHDLNITTWGTSVQAAVTSIRNAGASDQMILLPGSNFTSAEEFVSSGSAAALSLVKNPDGSSSNLIFDVHKYLDVDSTGTHDTCVGDAVKDTFTPLATYLRANKRQAILSETGGGNTDSCVTDLCAELSYLNNNTDVFLGYLGWAAGSFNATYMLSETPTKGSNNKYTDNALMSQCIVGTRHNSTGSGTKKNDGQNLVPSFTTFAMILTSLLLIV